MVTTGLSHEEREYLRQMFCLLMRKDRSNERLRSRERNGEEIILRYRAGAPPT